MLKLADVNMFPLLVPKYRRDVFSQYNHGPKLFSALCLTIIEKQGVVFALLAIRVLLESDFVYQALLKQDLKCNHGLSAQSGFIKRNLGEVTD